MGGTISAIVCIMPKMNAARSSVRSFLALMLPLSLVWLLVACIFICATHLTEEAGSAGQTSYAIGALPDDDCCPVTVSAIELPNPFSLTLSAAANIGPSLPLGNYGTVSHVSSETLPPSIGPPFKQLCSLRI